MVKKKIEHAEGDKEPVQKVHLECVTSPDGKGMYCTLLKPEDLKKLLQKNAVTAVTSTVSSSAGKVETKQEQIESENQRYQDTDSEADDIDCTDDCGCEWEESGDEESEDPGDTSPITDEQLVGDGDEVRGSDD